MIFGSTVWHCLILAGTERGGDTYHLEVYEKSRGQGLSEWIKKKRRGAGMEGEQRVGSPFDKTQDGLMTSEADGDSRLPRWCRQRLHPDAEVGEESGKKGEKENVFIDFT